MRYSSCLMAALSLPNLAGSFRQPSLIRSVTHSHSHFVRKNHGSAVSIGPLSASKLGESVDLLREKLETPPESILKAVERSPSDRRLAVSDAAALAGVDLVTARNGLMTLATLTGGDLEVTNDGEIIYSFPANFRSILMQRSLGQRIKGVYNTVFPSLFFVARASFGVALLTSLAILVTTFIFVSTSSSSNNNDNNNNNNRRRSSFSSIGSLDGVFDYFYFRPNYGYYTAEYYRPRFDGYDPITAGNGGISFIESFFSYVFGDGDPNKEFSNVQLRTIADAIRENNGVVIAEQLAAYMDPPAPAVLRADGEDTDVVVDESWVLPAVLQLGGTPAVTTDGDIVYQFQDLVTTAKNTFPASDGYPKSEQPYIPTAPVNLKEIEVPLSAAQGGQVAVAGVLGVLNLLGSLKLGSILQTPALFSGEPLIYAALTKLYPFLLAYAVAYNVIPLARWIFLQKKNSDAEQRNQKRQIWRNIIATARLTADKNTSLKVVGPSFDRIQSGDKYWPLMQRVAKKLASARAAGLLQTKPKVIGSAADQIAYSTKQTTTVVTSRDDGKDELQLSEEEVLKQFDRKLGDK